jgi:hypothetical protein
VAPGIVGDLVLLTAELLENASNFSPPHTRVTIAARAVSSGVRMVVIDNGIGMSDERLAEENARLVRRERLDLVPSRVLGLFVAGRLARRHGFGVALTHTPAGGVTATVDLAHSHVITAPLPSVEVPVAAAPPRAVLASEVMQDWRPWNAFEVGARPQPQPQPQPQPSSGLRRRVPGQQLPPGPERVVPEAPPADPQAARDLVEQFEAGVRRAGERPLRRRTPGASLSGMERPAQPSARAEAVPDPEAARRLVEQFETGVARALRDATDTHEGTPQ